MAFTSLAAGADGRLALALDFAAGAPASARATLTLGALAFASFVHAHTPGFPKASESHCWLLRSLQIEQSTSQARRPHMELTGSGPCRS